MTIGLTPYWDNTAKNVTTLSTSHKKIGVTFDVTLSGDVLGRVIMAGAFW